jgi:hypothetical protein
VADIRTAEGREVILSRLRPVFPAMGSAAVEYGRPIAQSLGKVGARTWAGAGGGLIALAAIAWAVDKFLLTPPKKTSAAKPASRPRRAAAAASARKPASRARPVRKSAKG